MFLLSTPLASRGLLESLEFQYPKNGELPEEIDAIIVMGAGAIPPDGQETKTLLTTNARERCRHALRLFNKFDHPDIILCGSKVLAEAPGESEAVAMKQYLIEQGVSENYLLTEEQSVSSYENIRNVNTLIQNRKADHVLLVTHAYHLPRTIRCCEKQGLNVFASGCGYRSKDIWRPWYTDIIPSTSGFAKSGQAIHEWMGIVWYWVTGKI